jgi:hypothetical protein
MATGQIAILEGYQIPRYGTMPRKRKRSGASGAQQNRFKKAAKKCARRRSGSFRLCMKRELKGKGRKGRKSRGRGRKACPPGCRKG